MVCRVSWGSSPRQGLGVGGALRSLKTVSPWLAGSDRRKASIRNLGRLCLISAQAYRAADQGSVAGVCYLAWGFGVASEDREGDGGRGGDHGEAADGYGEAGVGA